MKVSGFMQHTITRFNLHNGAVQRASDLAYWLAQPVRARIDAVEVLREQRHRYDYPGRVFADIRMHRVCSIRSLKTPLSL